MISLEQDKLTQLNKLKTLYQGLHEQIDILSKKKDVILEAITSLLPPDKTMEGTVSAKLNDMEKVSVTYRMNRTICQKAIDDNIHKMPDFLTACFKPVWDLNTAKYRQALIINPVEVSKFVTEKKGKPSLTITKKKRR